ncbi:MAG: GGDEF domain-containing protein [Acidimicrobiales bacterium]
MSRRSRLRPLEALEVSLRRLRLVGLLFLVAAGVFQRGANSFTIAGVMLVIAFGLLLIEANLASKRMSTPGVSVERLVLIQLAIDVIVTTGALLYFDPRPGTFVWVIVGLPVLEGAMRYGLVGAASAWLAITTTLVGWMIIGWSPGDGLESIIDLAGMLSIGLGLGIPAGHIADQLTEELVDVADQRHEAQRRSRFLAVLAVAGNDLTILDKGQLCLIATQATIELGYQGAEVGTVDLTTADWHPLQSEPTGISLPALSTEELSQIGSAAEGSVLNGLNGVAGDDLVGVLEIDSSHATVLRARVDDGDLSPPRDEAFTMLCATTATALAASARHFELSRARRQLQHDATHDALTGVLNRAGLLAALESALTQVGTGRRARTVMMIDLDGFKAVNDTYGHEAGDAVLVEVAARLKAATSERTIVARLGGDEFVLVVVDSQPDELQVELEGLIEQPVATPAGNVAVGASIGAHILDDPTCSPAEALRQADVRMYAAKASRKGPPAGAAQKL